MEAYEKLGQFYLGASYDLEAEKIRGDLVLYDSKDLTTHALCVGMTGSGKTGLCISLLEEAAIDGIPALVIDPKGDMGNLLLTFAGLTAEEFAPWVSPDEARREDLTVEEFAARQAELWRGGLAKWGQGPQRIARLREAADFTIYTPGSESGLPLSIVSSFAAPGDAVRADPELFTDRITSTATSLLALLRIKADPLQSREHVLISNILQSAWTEGRDLDLPGLIQAIQNPPMTRIGVFEVEAFYPSDERFKLAMALNNLLAAPGFDAWLKGEPLNVDRLLYTETGKPRISILSIAHLSDAERMFFVSLLLNETLGWVRSRPGASALRAILYMDEIFGFMPPVAEPPSKKPLLTLLKQARAFGLGVVLATQNPADLDYKGLSNIGTWFLGRLQTERDKLRVLEGLEGAAASARGRFDRGKMEETLAGLGKRVFLMHNVHEDEPVVFHTRWAMSYLRGPITRQEMSRLVADRRDAAAARGLAAPAPETPDVPGNGVRTASTQTPQTPVAPELPPESRRPLLPPQVPEAFLPVRRPAPGDARLAYVPSVLGIARVHYANERKGVDHEERVTLLAELDDRLGHIEWGEAVEADLDEDTVRTDPEPSAMFAELSPEAAKKDSPKIWNRELQDYLYRNRRLELLQSPGLGVVSRPGELERDFRIRLADDFREKRDEAVKGLRDKYRSRTERIEERIRAAERAVERERDQARQQKLQTAISLGTTVLSAFLGRKRMSRATLGRATTAARGASRATKEAQDVARAEAKLQSVEEQLAELEMEFQRDVAELEGRLDHRSEDLERLRIKPLKRDVDVRMVAVGWRPYWETADGRRTPAW